MEEVVCLLLALLVADEKEETLGPTQTVSLDIYLISRTQKQQPKLNMLCQLVGETQ